MSEQIGSDLARRRTMGNTTDSRAASITWESATTSTPHSWLPWSMLGTTHVIDARGSVVTAIAEPMSDAFFPDREDAAFICRAVNNYGGVLAALKALVARAEREMVDPIDVGEIQYAKGVIAKAEAHG
jgi:hypothetical protein